MARYAPRTDSAAALLAARAGSEQQLRFACCGALVEGALERLGVAIELVEGALERLDVAIELVEGSPERSGAGIEPFKGAPERPRDSIGTDLVNPVSILEILLNAFVEK